MMSETAAENLRRHAKDAGMTHAMSMLAGADELDKYSKALEEISKGVDISLSAAIAKKVLPPPEAE